MSGITILSEIVLKTLEDRNCTPEIAICFAVFAKNCLLNSGGYSPFQLVFGQNPVLPSVIDGKVPYFNENSVPTFVSMHLDALNKARVAYLQAECSNRIRTAIRTNLRPDHGPFQTGETVFYQRDYPNWRGPAKVIGQDGKQVFLRHSGSVIRVHPCKLRKSATEISLAEEEARESDICQKSVGVPQLMESDDEEDLQALASASPDCPEVSSEASEKAPFVPRHDKLPKKNDTIQFKPTNWPDDQWFTAKVLGRAGKATGKNKKFFNIEYQSPSDWEGYQNCIDFSEEVADWRNLEESQPYEISESSDTKD